MGVFRVLAAILHLGNVEIRDKDSDSSTIAVRMTHTAALHVRGRVDVWFGGQWFGLK